MENTKVIFHVDVNSAFLSWTAVDKLNNGEKVDIRDISSVIGGDEESRHGIVLAKSTSAKSYGIVTGESLYSARKKCPDVLILPPCFSIYKKCSLNMMNLLKEYTPVIEQYSIDECFMDMSAELKGSEPLEVAENIRVMVKEVLGFTVSVGVSTNKVLAKMASELRKPDKVNTLYPYEIKAKLWPLPVEELFMVGKSAVARLNNIYIHTIGDLANYNVDILEKKFKSYGRTIWQYANGIDNSKVEPINDSEMKVISNSTTLSQDIISMEEANKVIIMLCENIAFRLRKINKCCTSVSVSIRSSNFNNYSHQKKFKTPTDSTKKIVEVARILFAETWRNEPIRLIGVQLSGICNEQYSQISLFDTDNDEKGKLLDRTIDSIREKYGNDTLKRSIFIEKPKK